MVSVNLLTNKLKGILISNLINMQDLNLNDLINQRKFNKNHNIDSNYNLLPLFKVPIRYNNEYYILKKQNNSNFIKKDNLKSFKEKINKPFIKTKMSYKDEWLNNSEINLSLISNKEIENIQILLEFTNYTTVSFYYLICLIFKYKELEKKKNYNKKD